MAETKYKINILHLQENINTDFLFFPGKSPQGSPLSSHPSKEIKIFLHAQMHFPFAGQ